MDRYEGPLFDSDNHLYEAEDAFTRHVPERMRHRCVEWVQIGKKRYHLVGGRLSYAVGNPTFNPISKPGALRPYYRGNPEGKTFADLIRSSLEPMPREYMDRDARVAKVEEQGLDATWIFPTAGVLYEQALIKDIDALLTTHRAFNRWLEEDWGLTYKGKLFCAPYITLADVDWACEELEWALARDARIVVMRPAPVHTQLGWKSHCDPEFDPFWARANEAGITVVAHVGSTPYTSIGYGGNSTAEALGGGKKPSVSNMIPERAIFDFLLTFAYDRLFERFPNLRIASIENGAEFLGDLFRKLESSKRRYPRYYKEDPVALFKEHVWINPFWEDDLREVISQMGPDRVIFGSDWPHMEGLEQPRQIFDEVDGISLADQKKFLHDNTAALNERRPA